MSQILEIPPPREVTDPVVAFHQRVDGLCKERLKDALNPVNGLFNRQLRRRTWQATEGTEDLTSTAIGLIGLHRAGIAPESIGLAPQRSLRALAALTQQRRYKGALGLVVWANAVWDDLPLPELLTRTRMTLEPTRELTAGLTTMEVGWLVSGLVHEHARAPSGSTRAALEAARAALLARQHPKTHLFWHAAREAPLAHRLRRGVSNFADQIYAVHAAALLAVASDDRVARAAADACAARLVELQGALGQWWWHYDPRDGRVAQGYPVYSVHQHAMAPFALSTLAAAGGTDHRAAVELSHAWLGRNELGAMLVDRAAGTVWRDVQRVEREVERVLGHARSVVGWKPRDGGTRAQRLQVNYETRPYEWAWCLFAGAIAAGHKRAHHLV